MNFNLHKKCSSNPLPYLPDVSFTCDKLGLKLGHICYFGTKIIECHSKRVTSLECQVNFILHAYGQVAQLKFIQIVIDVTFFKEKNKFKFKLF